ncbi:MAG: transporter, permease/ATP-binding protein [Firmicutes bacterium]|nr:transporter, permease/ATP-binding protein [Bacillota bacterium]
MYGRTTFIIAHRLNTIQEADQILVLKNGEIVEQGSHSELLAAEGIYSAMFSSQLENKEEFDITTMKYI